MYSPSKQKNVVSRRSLLSSLRALPLAFGLPRALLASKSPSFPQGIYVAGVLTLKAGVRGSALAVFELSQKKTHLIEMGYGVHGVMPDVKFNHLYCSAKEVKGIKVLDLSTGKVVKELTLENGKEFCGHGLVDPKRNVIYFGVMDPATKNGHITVYELGSFKKLEQFASGGQYPHEIVLSSDEKKLIVANSYGASEMSFLDVTSGKKLAAVGTPTQGVGLRHVQRLDENHLLIGTSLTPDLSKITMREPRVVLLNEKTGEISEIMINKHLAGTPLARHHISESLSICLDKRRQRFAVTLPYNDAVVFFDLKGFKILGANKMLHPAGIDLTPDGRFYLVSCKTLDAGLRFIDAETMAEAPEWAVEQDYEHLAHGSFVPVL